MGVIWLLVWEFDVGFCLYTGGVMVLRLVLGFGVILFLLMGLRYGEKETAENIFTGWSCWYAAEYADVFGAGTTGAI